MVVPSCLGRGGGAGPGGLASLSNLRYDDGGGVWAGHGATGLRDMSASGTSQSAGIGIFWEREVSRQMVGEE